MRLQRPRLRVRPIGVLVTINRQNLALEAAAAAAGKRVAISAVEPDYVGLESLAKLVEDGKLPVYVSETRPLEAASESHQLYIRGGVMGTSS